MAIFQTDGARLSYEISGEGPIFVQLHGLTSSGQREHRAGLDMSIRLDDHQVLRYDARGHGNSTGRQVPEDYVWPNLATDLLTLLDELAPGQQVHGSGPSMGAATLLHAALRQPQRFATLTLAVPPTAWGTRQLQARNYRASAALVEEDGIGAFVSVGRDVLPPPALADRPRERVPAVSQELLPAIFRGAAMTDLPSKAEVASIEVPALILAWVDDYAHPVSTAETLHELLPNSRLMIAETPDDLESWPDRVADHVAQNPVQSPG